MESVHKFLQKFKKKISDKYPFVYNYHSDRWKTKWNTKGKTDLFYDYSWASIFMEFVKLHFKDTLWTMFLHVTIKNIVRILTLMNI